MASAQPPTLGQLLKRYRIAAGLTQEVLAERAGLSARGISDIERGLRYTSYQDTISKLAQALQLSATERAQFEAAARRRSIPSARRSPGAPADRPTTSPETPTGGVPAPVSVSPAPGMGVPAETWSGPSSAGARSPMPRPSEPLPSERAILSSPPLRVRDVLVTRPVRALLVGILLVGVLFSAGVVGQQPRIGGGTLCLATEFPTTGEEPFEGSWGKSLEHAVELAVELAVEQNQSLGDGYTLATIHYNETSKKIVQQDPRQGAQNVTDMVKTPCILGMVGPVSSRVAVAEMPITAQAGLVMISPANTMPALTLRLYAGIYGVDFDQHHPAGKKINYFRNIANDALQGLELADFTSRSPPAGLGASRAFVVDDHTPYSEVLIGGYTQRFLEKGGAIVGTESIPFGGVARIAELAARIAATRPDVVCYGGMTDPEGGLLKAQLVQAGYLGLFVGGDGIAGDPAFVDQVGAAAANDIFAINPVPDPAQITSGAAARFVRDFHARYPGEVLDGYGANAYDAAMLLITAIKRLIRAGQEVTRQALLDQVQNIQYAGVTGQISFDHNGDSAHGIFSVYTIQDGHWVWVKQSSV